MNLEELHKLNQSPINEEWAKIRAYCENFGSCEVKLGNGIQVLFDDAQSLIDEA